MQAEKRAWGRTPGPRRTAGWLFKEAIGVVAVVVSGLAVAADPGGPARSAAATGLLAPVDGSWAGVPLRTWADRAADIAGRPVVIDRRLDPEGRVTLDGGGEPLARVLETVARSIGAEVVPLRSSIRIVPLKTAAAACGRAESARERDIKALPPAARQPISRRAGWEWPDGARPRQLVAAALDQAGVTAEGIDRVPHDHFPAASLPPMSLGERLDLVLAHFDLRIEWRNGPAGPVATVVAIDPDLPAVPATGPKPSRPARPAGGGNAAARRTFTLEATAPLEELLGAVAGRLGATLDIDHQALAARGIAPREIVRVKVEDASVEELLAAILGPLELKGKVVADRLEVRGADTP